jgi:predicted nucleotidyltransferase
MHPILANKRKEIANLCRRFQVTRLDAFGSVVNGDFDPSRSDIDVVAEFAPDSPSTIGLRQYFEFKQELERILDRPVDVIELQAMPDSRLRRLIERSRVAIYAEAA